GIFRLQSGRQAQERPRERQEERPDRQLRGDQAERDPGRRGSLAQLRAGNCPGEHEVDPSEGERRGGIKRPHGGIKSPQWDDSYSFSNSVPMLSSVMSTAGGPDVRNGRDRTMICSFLRVWSSFCTSSGGFRSKTTPSSRGYESRVSRNRVKSSASGESLTARKLPTFIE